MFFFASPDEVDLQTQQKQNNTVYRIKKETRNGWNSKWDIFAVDCRKK